MYIDSRNCCLAVFKTTLIYTFLHSYSFDYDHIFLFAHILFCLLLYPSVLP
nr:MAG TPA: hypothetical protein [Caudoviricetes sp.]